LPRLDAPARPPNRHQTKFVSLGGCLLPNVDNVAEVLSIAEGDGFH
jgi:hypothetical protein